MTHRLPRRRYHPMRNAKLRRFKPILAGLAFLVAGCAGSRDPVDLASGHVNWVYRDPSYTPIQDVNAAGGSGQLLTQILGNPFNVDQEQFDTAVTDAMYGANWGPRTHFTAAPEGSFKRL